MGPHSDSLSSAGGGQISFETLVTAYHGDVFRSALFLTGQVNDAEDMTQQTFLQAMQKIGQLRDMGSAKSWLLTILRNCFLQDRRRKREIPWEHCESVVSPASVDNETAKRVDVEPTEIVAAVQSLDENHRIVITMFYLERRSYQDIARELGIKLGTVMSRLSRAKIQLRKIVMHQQHA